MEAEIESRPGPETRTRIGIDSDSCRDDDYPRSIFPESLDKCNDLRV